MAVKPNARGYLEVQKGAGAWHRLRFITEASFASTPPTPSTESFLDEPDEEITGRPGRPSWTTTVALNDAAMAYRLLQDAYRKETSLNFRETAGIPDKIFEGAAGNINIVAIANTCNWYC